jgi:hypothetical protein
MSIKSFVGWTLATAVLTPLAPFGVIYAFVHEVQQCGNGADAFGTFAIGALGIIGTIAGIVLVPIAIANPVIGGAVYGAWCLGVGAWIGLSK